MRQKLVAREFRYVRGQVVAQVFAGHRAEAVVVGLVEVVSVLVQQMDW